MICSVLPLSAVSIWPSKTSAASSTMTMGKVTPFKRLFYLAAPVVVNATISADSKALF